MKHFLKISLLALGLWFLAAPAQAQHETGLDMENWVICLTDSISPTNQVQFWKIVYLNTKLTENWNFSFTALYFPTGTVIPCSGNAAPGQAGSCARSLSFENVTANDTIPAGTVNSISIAALNATVTVKVGSGSAVTLDAAAKEVFSYAAPNACATVPEQIIIGVSGGGNAHVAKSQ